MNKSLYKLDYLLPVLEIYKKENISFFQTYLGWFILALACMVNGILGWWGINKSNSSTEALQLIFYSFSGTTMTAGILIGMKLISEEKSLGTLELLITAPIHESQIILGKYFSAVSFLVILLLVSIPIPLIPLFFGDAKIGHILSGYIGNLFLGSASVAISLFYSTLSRVQLLTAIMAGANLILFLLLGFFSPYLSSPMKNIVREFSLYLHYRNFEQGVLVLKHFVFFFSVIIFYLYLSIASLQSSRWR